VMGRYVVIASKIKIFAKVVFLSEK
jgi:hypothetical protein